MSASKLTHSDNEYWAEKIHEMLTQKRELTDDVAKIEQQIESWKAVLRCQGDGDVQALDFNVDYIPSGQAKAIRTYEKLLEYFRAMSFFGFKFSPGKKQSEVNVEVLSPGGMSISSKFLLTLDLQEHYRIVWHNLLPVIGVDNLSKKYLTSDEQSIKNFLTELLMCVHAFCRRHQQVVDVGFAILNPEEEDEHFEERTATFQVTADYGSKDVLPYETKYDCVQLPSDRSKPTQIMLDGLDVLVQRMREIPLVDALKEVLTLEEKTDDDEESVESFNVF